MYVSGTPEEYRMHSLSVFIPQFTVEILYSIMNMLDLTSRDGAADGRLFLVIKSNSDQDLDKSRQQSPHFHLTSNQGLVSPLRDILAIASRSGGTLFERSFGALLVNARRSVALQRKL